MLPTITIMSHLSDESVLATVAERVGKCATAPKQRKMMQELDERTKTQQSATYTVGKGEAEAVRKPCTRLCVVGQGP
jgi:hypothetical protein